MAVELGPVGRAAVRESRALRLSGLSGALPGQGRPRLLPRAPAGVAGGASGGAQLGAVRLADLPRRRRLRHGRAGPARRTRSRARGPRSRPIGRTTLGALPDVVAVRRLPRGRLLRGAVPRFRALVMAVRPATEVDGRGGPRRGGGARPRHGLVPGGGAGDPVAARPERSPPA